MTTQINLTDIHYTELILSGRSIVLYPLTDAIIAEAEALARLRHAGELAGVAAQCGLPEAEIQKQAYAGEVAYQAADVLTMLWLRTRHSGVSFEYLQEIPLPELMSHQAEIMADVQFDRIMEAHGGKPVLSPLDIQRLKLVRHYPGYTLGMVRSMPAEELVAHLRYLDYEAGDESAASIRRPEVKSFKTIAEALEYTRRINEEKAEQRAAHGTGDVY